MASVKYFLPSPSASMYAYLSVCLFVCLVGWLIVCLFGWLFVCLFVCIGIVRVFFVFEPICNVKQTTIINFESKLAPITNI